MPIDKGAFFTFSIIQSSIKVGSIFSMNAQIAETQYESVKSHLQLRRQPTFLDGISEIILAFFLPLNCTGLHYQQRQGRHNHLKK